MLYLPPFLSSHFQNWYQMHELFLRVIACFKTFKMFRLCSVGSSWWEPLGVDGTSVGTHCLIPCRVDSKGENSVYIVSDRWWILPERPFWMHSVRRYWGLLSNCMKSSLSSLELTWSVRSVPCLCSPFHPLLKVLSEMLMGGVFLRNVGSRLSLRQRRRRAYLDVQPMNIHHRLSVLLRRLVCSFKCVSPYLWRLSAALYVNLSSGSESHNDWGEWVPGVGLTVRGNLLFSFTERWVTNTL